MSEEMSGSREDLIEKLGFFMREVEPVYSSQRMQEAGKTRCLTMANDFLFFKINDLRDAFFEHRHGVSQGWRPATSSLLNVMRKNKIGDYFEEDGELKMKYKNKDNRFPEDSNDY